MLCAADRACAPTPAGHHRYGGLRRPCARRSPLRGAVDLQRRASVRAGCAPGSRGWTSALLGAAAGALVRDGVLQADVVIGWGEPSARALAALPATRRVLVVPDGRAGAPLSPEERIILSGPDEVELPTPCWAGHGRSGRGRGAQPSGRRRESPQTRTGRRPRINHWWWCGSAATRRPTIRAGIPVWLTTFPPRAGRQSRVSQGAGPPPDPGGGAANAAGGDTTTECGTGARRCWPRWDSSPASTWPSCCRRADRSLAERARILAIQNPGRMALVEDPAILPASCWPAPTLPPSRPRKT